ncbi:MAG: isoleucine--tRNA ligase [Thermoguttaceae bacterium]
MSFAPLEQETIEFWKRHQIYEKSLAARAGATPFVFYEGPPTANGLPHPGHCLTRAIKDLYPRYKTMRGFLCQRKAGWDTHGLPVEVEVCKELGIHSKEEIETFGVEPFVHKCLESVFRYTKQWEDLTERIGFWINLDEAYVTFHQSYIESVWWSLKELFDRGLLYQGHKIVWWWAQGGTALSSGEVGQGYREVADPSVFVRFPLVNGACDIDADLLVWTTTPWTLPSNQFAAVHSDVEYAVVAIPDARNVIVAATLVESLCAKIKCEGRVLHTLRGSELVGMCYVPPFTNYHAARGEECGSLLDGKTEPLAWRVVAADFVTTDSGTGIVHIAPAFGEDDFNVLLREQSRFAESSPKPELLCAVNPDGTFSENFPEMSGRWVKECDKEITRSLRDRKLLFHQEQYLHEYPFCWRADSDPLIQYPRRSWFIKTSLFKDAMLENNAKINWLPEHIRDGRFGNFLASNVDWALSRERYWGTPLPIWVCEETGYTEAISSYNELRSKPGATGFEVWDEAKRKNSALSDHLKVHKPYIDAITYDSPKSPGHKMRRVSEVIDCWYDSGAMPFAQWGFPHLPSSAEKLDENLPADFISEAIDQTRGWFYSQLAISTLLFGKKKSYPLPFKNCIVLGLMLGEDGQKMSKSKRNYREPREILDKYGADALRWYFYATQTPWTSIRYSEQAIKDSMPEFLIRLTNVMSFYQVYSEIDKFDPQSHTASPVAARDDLDRWILGELHKMISVVVERMDCYDHFAACAQISEFVDSLSNWYVRRNRDRFWSGDLSASKCDAYFTLRECLVSTAKIIAPFVPFVAERMWQQLRAHDPSAPESVHLCDYPQADLSHCDAELSLRVSLTREIVSVGRAARMVAKIKVRQPLAKMEVVFSNPQHLAWLQSHKSRGDEMPGIKAVLEEMNVKAVEFTTDISDYVDYIILPNLKKLGRDLGKRLPKLQQYLKTADAAHLMAKLDAHGCFDVLLDSDDEAITLTHDDLQIRIQAKDGWAAAHGANCVVVLQTELTDALIAEGFARELIRAIQNRRKEIGCAYTDRIAVGVLTDSATIRDALTRFGSEIQGETLATQLACEPIANAEPVSLELDEERLELFVSRVAQ